jgi:Tol biopolymer transport system component
VHGGTSGLHIVDVGEMDGSFATDTLEATLLYGPARVSNATWSPDGAWIAFDQISAEEHEPWDLQQQGTSGIWIVRADGSDSRLLASGAAAEGPGYPTWSPDSASVAYITTPNQGRPDAWKLDLWTVAIDGGQPARIYESDCCFDDYRKPAWSPDGEWIAFGIHVPGRGPESGILVLRPDGSEAHLASAYLLEPVWQPLPVQPGEG